eukprot:2044664-Pleurochrysis_carterae.AAC.1
MHFVQNLIAYLTRLVLIKCFVPGTSVAIKDTFDLSGYPTAYGSWQFLNNVITESESPLATYAMQA